MPQRHRDTENDALTETIIGCAIEVHRALGPGLREHSYEDAMCIEFDDRAVAYARQVCFTVRYKGHVVGKHEIDLIVADLVVVEIKAVEQIHPVFETQLLTYLRVSEKHVGLLLNFNSRVLKDGVMRRVL